MKPKTELLLYTLSWRFETLMNPSISNLLENFEGWAYRSGFLDRIHELEAEGFLERHPDADPEGAGLRLAGAVTRKRPIRTNPEKAWKRKWKKQWHLVLFDLPANASTSRKRLHRALREHGFGRLQDSLWIHPVLPRGFRPFLKGEGGRPGGLVMFSCASKGGPLDRWMVEDAWDWEKLSKGYENYFSMLGRLVEMNNCRDLLGWARKEAKQWQHLCDQDPFLPAVLLPDGYEGRDAWRLRKRKLVEAECRIRDLFQPPQR